MDFKNLNSCLKWLEMSSPVNSATRIFQLFYETMFLKPKKLRNIICQKYYNQRSFINDYLFICFTWRKFKNALSFDLLIDKLFTIIQVSILLK